MCANILAFIERFEASSLLLSPVLFCFYLCVLSEGGRVFQMVGTVQESHTKVDMTIHDTESRGVLECVGGMV